jgi:dTDP-4-amino-4,6-dideoxygalactose transaminase
MPEAIALVDVRAAYEELRDEIDEALHRVCRHGAFVGGEEVEAFEAAWAEYSGARHAIGVANGTDALTLALVAADLPTGSAVILPANTFIATAEAVVAARLRPRFVDVEPDTGLAQLERCAEAVDGTVSAIIPVHLYGRVMEMEPVLELAADNDLVVVEDAAQAHGGRRHGRHAGTFGHAGCFSFYPGKNLGAFGDAGAVITDDDEIADRVRLLRDHGRRGRDRHEVVGVNSRLDAFQAAVLLVKLRHLERWTRERRRVAETYRALLDPELLDWPGDADANAETHHLFPILSDERDELAEQLGAEGIATGVHYRVPVPATAAFGSHEGLHPVAERRAARQLSLPIHPHLSSESAEWVAAEVSGLVGAAA